MCIFFVVRKEVLDGVVVNGSGGGGCLQADGQVVIYEADRVSWVPKGQRRQGSCKLTFIFDSLVLQNHVFHLSDADALILACFHEVERYRPRTPGELCVLVCNM